MDFNLKSIFIKCIENIRLDVKRVNKILIVGFIYLNIFFIVLRFNDDS